MRCLSLAKPLPGGVSNNLWVVSSPGQTPNGVGVQCDSTNTKVVMLNFGLCQLSGSSASHFSRVYATAYFSSHPVPASIGAFTDLTHLSFAYDHLHGSIPPSIGSLTNLVRSFALRPLAIILM